MTRTDDIAADLRGYLDHHLARWGEPLDVKVDVADFSDWVARVEALGAVMEVAAMLTAADRDRLAALTEWDAADAALLAVKRAGVERAAEYWEAAERADKAVIALKEVCRLARPEELARRTALFDQRAVSRPHDAD